MKEIEAKNKSKESGKDSNSIIQNNYTITGDFVQGNKNSIKATIQDTITSPPNHSQVQSETNTKQESIQPYKNQKNNDEISKILEQNGFTIDNEKLIEHKNDIDFNIYDSSNSQTLLNIIYFPDDLIDNKAIESARFPVAVTQWIYETRYNKNVKAILVVVIPKKFFDKRDYASLSNKYSIAEKITLLKSILSQTRFC